MNFKYWFILSEELYQNNTATIFHRTPSFERVQGMMNGGFTAGTGDWHGPGLYTTYTLEGTTNLGYGPYVVKLKVNNLKNYFVLEPDIAKQIHGNNWKLKDQARILELTLNLTDEQWQKYQEISETGKFGSAAASTALKKDLHKLWEHGCKGIIYNGSNDGKCICVYAPYEGLQFLAYAHAPTPTTVDFIEKNWIKSGKDVSTRSTVNIRSISGFKFPKNIGSTSVKKQYDLPNPENQKNTSPDMFDDVKDGKYLKARLYLKNNKLTDQNVYDFLRYAPNKNKMAIILGPDNINKLNYDNVYNLLLRASDIDEMARILGPDNINKLDNENVYVLLAFASNKEEMAEILGPDNINKLNYDNVYNLLYYAPNKEKIAEILGPDNINKLSDSGVYDLLKYADDKEKMINFIIKYKTELSNVDISNLINLTPYKDKMLERLGPNNINKLNNDNVYDLLDGASDKEKMVRILGQDKLSKLNADQVSNLIYYTSDKDKMANILGSENINKIIDDGDPAHIDWLFSDQEPIEGKEEMKQILRKYYTGTNQEVISLLKQ
jgi:hypothetical protein